MKRIVKKVTNKMYRMSQERKKRVRERQLMEWLSLISSYCGTFQGKKILEVGCDLAGNLVQTVHDHFQPMEIIGLNPLVEFRDFSESCRLQKGNICQTPYPDHCFDIIISSSAFEHILNFDQAVDEMHRLLKTGGYLFSHFGPIWSTSYGHHLWTNFQGRSITYWNLLLPPFCHLLMTQEELKNHLMDQGNEPDFSDHISDYVFNSNEQNRLFFEDFQRILEGSKFQVLFFKGYDHPELSKKYNSRLAPGIFQDLQSRYPAHRNFLYDGITTLLKK